MDHLIHEVDEDLRRERMQKLWQSFGRYIVAASFLIVLGTATVVGWKNYQHSKQEAWTETLLNAQSAIIEEDYTTAAELLHGIDTSDDNAATLAALNWLNIPEEHRKVEGDAEGVTPTIPSSMKRSVYGTIYHLFEDNSHEAAESDSSVAVSFHAFAQEQQALKLYREGKRDEAYTIFAALSAEATTPPGVRNRAKLLLNSIGKPLSSVPAADDATDASPAS